VDKLEIFRQAMDELLRSFPIKKVYFATGYTRPPLFGYIVNFPRLSVPLSGHHEMEIELDGKATTLQPCQGEAVLIPPNCWNRPTWRKPVEVLSVLFGKKRTGISLVRGDGSSEENLWVEKIATHRVFGGPIDRIMEILLELRREQKDFAAFPQLVEVLIECCRATVEKSHQIAGRRSRHLFDDMCVYLQQNFHYGITRDLVAKQFNISSNHLSRVFRQEGSMKFSDYLIFVRIDRAKFMLSRYDMILYEISQRCGFKDVSYFCRTFKRITGQTPAEYRRNIRDRQVQKS
jgi:AraC-like DNA-binding protein